MNRMQAIRQSVKASTAYPLGDGILMTPVNLARRSLWWVMYRRTA